MDLGPFCLIPGILLSQLLWLFAFPLQRARSKAVTGSMVICSWDQ